MKTIGRVFLSLSFVLVLLEGAEAREDNQSEPTVERNQVVVKTRGVVCSFCARGAEKALSNIPGLNSELYGDGIKIDIERNEFTLVMEPGAEFPFQEIFERIKKGGYDAIAVYLRIRGRVERKQGASLIKNIDNGQVFSLTGEQVAELSTDADIDIQGHFDARKIPSFKEGAPVEVIVDKILFSEQKSDD